MLQEPLSESPTPAETTSEKALRRGKRKAVKEERQARRNPKPITARSSNQTAYINSIRSNSLTFAIGPAGVGKTYVPARIFGEMLVAGTIEKLYVARPNISKPKHRNGFLPGSLEDKTAPWMIPVFEGVRDAMSPSLFTQFRRESRIEEVPYEYMQGRTFANAGCIIDEAENLDIDDLYITLTRQGEALSMVVCGDIAQARISDSGLAEVVSMARAPWMQSTGVIEFSEEDVVRSAQAKQWVKAFNNRGSKNNLHNAGYCDMANTAEFHSNPPNFLRAA